MSFSSLGLSSKVLSAVESAGYSTPTAIQSGAIPYILERRDVLGIAQTGTGKTASFTLPMLTLLEKGRARARMPRTLILEPTRELAAQVKENFDKYGANHRLNVALLIGGVSFDEQNKILDRGADVLIATPGRLLDHIERGKLLMQGVDILVIDEADRMLDMGFIPDIERISKMIPFTRQTLFFSATMPPEIQKLADMFLQNPARIEVAKAATTADTVAQKLMAAGPEPWAKREKLRELIHQADGLKNAIIFCNRKRDVSTVFRSLERHDFTVGCLHGDMDQRARTMTLDAFRAGKIPLLVASDVAARGLDIPDVSHVFNFDVPVHAEDYVHRIGRTGRAGRSGTTYMIVTQSDEKHLAAIERLIEKTIDWEGEALDFSAPVSRSPRPSRNRKKQKGEQDDSSAKNKRASRPAKNEKIEEKQSRSEKTKADNSNGKPQKSHERNNVRGKRKGDSEPKVIGMGDHVPAFLLREVRPKRAAG
ncbi:MAG: DEAD/DEAH box helicase [Stappiaceae bacterium]